MRVNVLHLPVIDDELPSVVVDLVNAKPLPLFDMGKTHFLVGIELLDRFRHGHIRRYYSSRISAISR